MVVRIADGEMTLIGLNPTREEKHKVGVCGSAWKRSMSNKGLGKETRPNLDEVEDEDIARISKIRITYDEFMVLFPLSCNQE